MKTHKNCLLAGSGVMLLLVSSVLSVPRATRGSDSKSMGQTQSINSLQASATQLQSSERLAGRAKLASSSISQATAPDNSDDVSIDASLGDENISFERKKHRRSCCLVVISIIAVLVGRPSEAATPPMIDLRATLTGPDAVRGSLPFGLAWLAGDPDPLRSVRALGYDIEVSKEHERPCTDGPPSRECVERARRLATLVDATLGLGDAEERARFRRDAAAIGVAPDCAARATQATSPVSSAASPDSSVDLSMDASLGDEQISLERKTRRLTSITCHGVHLKRAVLLRAAITGPDAVPGSLLYALAWLDGDPDPLRSVRALGYDIDVSKQQEQPCMDGPPGQTCVERARQLATLVDATLGLGSPEERAQFRRDASALGVAPDCSLREP